MTVVANNDICVLATSNLISRGSANNDIVTVTSINRINAANIGVRANDVTKDTLPRGRIKSSATVITNHHVRINAARDLISTRASQDGIETIACLDNVVTSRACITSGNIFN